MRRFICSVLAFIICSFSILTYVYAEEVTDLQTEQERLQNEINDANQDLENVQTEISQNLEQVQKLDEKIQTSQTELEGLNAKITELQEQITDVEGKLEIEEERYGRQKDLLETRLVEMYETSETEYLDVILTSRSISEFLSNYFLITELTNYDTDLLNDVKMQKDEIELEKNKLNKAKEEYSTIKQNQLRTARVLENTKSLRENYISKLSEEERGIQAQIDDYNRQFEQVNAEILAIAAKGLDTKYIGGELAWPVPGYTRISSKFGMRLHPIFHVNKLHTGLDIGAPMGANFVAANDGIVTKAEMSSGYGNMVMIDHGGGISTLYAHGSEILVKAGQIVKRGEPVLKVGSTGFSTGAHAHFEVRINGVVTDPLPYVTNGVVPGSENTANTVNTTNTINTAN